MKIYRVIAEIYHYWLDECYSGYREESFYFQKESSANKFIKDLYANPYWYNIQNKKDFKPADYQMPAIRKEIIEIED